MAVRIAVIDDNPHLAWDGRVYPANATFHRFLSAILDVEASDGTPCVSRIDHCVPLGAADRQPATLPLDPRLHVVPTVPFDGIAGFVARAPAITRRNRAILGPVIRAADLAWLKVPASNAPLAAAIARSAGVERFSWVAGSALDVVRGQRRRGVAGLAAALTGGTYDIAGRLVGLGGARLVVGENLASSGIVASLVEPDELRNPEGTPWPAIPWRLRIAWAGRLAAGKGIEDLLEAVAILARRDGERRRVELVMVGDGPRREQLVDLASRLGIGERIHWLGYVADRAPYMDALAAADLFAFPSPAEGFPKAVLDAMAVGLPVVAAPSGQLAGLVDAGLVEPTSAGKPSAIADAVHALTGRPERATALRRLGFELASAHTRPSEAARVVSFLMARFPGLPWSRARD